MEPAVVTARTRRPASHNRRCIDISVKHLVLIQSELCILSCTLLPAVKTSYWISWSLIIPCVCVCHELPTVVLCHQMLWLFLHLILKKDDFSPSQRSSSNQMPMMAFISTGWRAECSLGRKEVLMDFVFVIEFCVESRFISPGISPQLILPAPPGHDQLSSQPWHHTLEWHYAWRYSQLLHNPGKCSFCLGFSGSPLLLEIWNSFIT